MGGFMKKKISIFIIVVIIISLLFHLISINIKPIIKEIAQKEMKQFCQLIVNHITVDYQTNNNELVIITRDSNDKISSVDFNMEQINKIAADMVFQIEELLLDLEEGNYTKSDSIYHKKLKKISDQKGVVASFPAGMVLNNPFLAHMGPNIKVRYQTLSHVSSSIQKEIKNYGINHMMVSLNIAVTMHLSVIVPFYQEEFIQKIQYPLILEIIDGEVPQWYQN